VQLLLEEPVVDDGLGDDPIDDRQIVALVGLKQLVEARLVDSYAALRTGRRATFGVDTMPIARATVFAQPDIRMTRGGAVDAELRREINLLHANVCQALADPTRILILYALSETPRRVSELAEALDAPQSTVSRHLKVLRDRRLVTTARAGAGVLYSLADVRVIEALDLLRAVLMSALSQQGELARRLS
jgi:ArsR family transcriptional regulator